MKKSNKVAAQQRAYYEANKDKLAAQQRAYREANKDKVAAQRRAKRSHASSGHDGAERGDAMRANLKAARRSAGLTQQAIADRLEISLRYYQRIESGENGGAFEVWDALEDLLGVHQRILRETLSKNPAPKGNRSEH